jgi:hypothetical protein
MQVILDTQKIVYNPQSKIAVTTIDEPFYSAGKNIPGWKWKPQAIGLNLRVIQFVLASNFTLVIYVDKYRHSYRITSDQLKQYIDNNNCDYKIKNTILKVIPIDLLTSFEMHKSTPKL